MGTLIKHFSLFLFFISFNSYALQCGQGEEDVSGVCVSSCKLLEGASRNLTYEGLTWGDSPSGFCVAVPSSGAACDMSGGSVAINLGGSTKWQKTFTFTGSTCSFSEINRFSGDTPEELPDTTGDLNQNGIPDADEDFDGDGIKNSEDTTPFVHDDKSNALDLNNNNIPDNLEPIYDELMNNKPEMVKCDNTDGECTRFSSVIRELAINNRELAEMIARSSISAVTSESFRSQMQDLRQYEYDQSQFTRLRVDSLNDKLNYNLKAINSNVYDLDRSIFKQRSYFSDLESSLDEHLLKVTENTALLNEVDTGINSVQDSVDSVTPQLNQIQQNMDTSLGFILDAIADGSSNGSGLTQTQKTQLKNAAKANANQKLIKELKPLVDQNLAVTKAVERNLDWFNEDFIAYSEKTDGQFSQLSEQIAAISGGTSTIDLSGVESSIDSLSSKIDGIESGDMSGIEGKLTDLIDGVTNNNPFVAPNYDFDGEGFLINQNEVAKAQEEVLELKEDISKQLEKFKTLFSIDTSSFNNGTFKEHNLNLYVEGQERSFKSGVLSALLDNAALIASVIMLLFVISGIKMLGRD